MASSSGNCSGSTQIQNSGSEQELQLSTDQRKRKRMQSNRESARRSRMRKQKHLDDLMAEIARLEKENDQILTGVSIATEQVIAVEAENSVLRAQVAELTQRLQSIEDIQSYMNASNGLFGTDEDLLAIPDNYMNNSWNLMFNHPIVASNDMFLY